MCTYLEMQIIGEDTNYTRLETKKQGVDIACTWGVQQFIYLSKKETTYHKKNIYFLFFNVVP